VRIIVPAKHYRAQRDVRRVHREMQSMLNLTPLLLPRAVEPKGRHGTDAEPFTDTIHGLDVRSDTERRRHVRSKRKNRLGKSTHIELRALDKMGRYDY